MLDLVLDLARSNLAYPAQILFLGLNAIGIIFGLAYNSQTPDLYPGSAHHRLSWVLTGIAVFQFGVRLLRSFAAPRARKITTSVNDERALFIPISETESTFHDAANHEDVEAASSRLSICRSEDGTSSNETDSETLYDVPLPRSRTSLERRYGQPMSWTKRWSNVVDTTRLIDILDIISTIFRIALIALAFVALCTGIVTMAGIFVSLLHLFRSPFSLTHSPARKTHLQRPSPLHQRRRFLPLRPRDFRAVDGLLRSTWLGLESQNRNKHDKMEQISDDGSSGVFLDSCLWDFECVFGASFGVGRSVDSAGF